MRSLVLLLASCVMLAVATAAGPPPDSSADSKLLADPGHFRTLVNPACSHCRDEAVRRAGELRDDDRVLAWTRGKYDGGAVPVRFFLAPYRVISDTYGVWVYDADAGFMRGFEPSLDFTFYGWRNGIIVIRHKDGTLYSALSGQAFDGPRKGDRLKPLATLPSDWGWWLKHYPGTVAYHMFDKYRPINLPTGTTPQSAQTRLPLDPRLSAERLVIGVRIANATRAYPVSELRKAGGIVADSLGGHPIVVLWHEATHAGAAYEPRVEGTDQRLTLSSAPADADAPFVDNQTGSHWDIAGRAVQGPLKGKALAWADIAQCYWFAWAAEYPRTDVYQAKTRVSAMLVRPESVNADQISRWQKSGVNAAVLVLDERHDASAYRAAACELERANLPLYYWIEIARNRAMADAHLRWMASLGMHQDWHSRFPDAPLPKTGEVTKAYPWVPITSKPAFEAHLRRIESLLRERSAGNYRGLLLNDLQAGPSSCGCGNLLCRWATDYKVPPTSDAIDPTNAAARFIEQVHGLAPGRDVIPVWTTECEDIDLPPSRAPGGKTTGLCGSVACADTTCPVAFTRQFNALLTQASGPIALLAVRHDLERPDFESEIDWPVKYLDRVLPARHTAPLPHERVWLVTHEPSGFGEVPSDIGGVVVAADPIPQDYQPRIVAVNHEGTK